jgi:TorA maturation chaperone TorD/ferredoxin
LNVLRANLYQALAEALAEPPGWLELPGVEWPLFEAALQLAPESEAARQAVLAMMEIGEESLEQRQARYTALFAGPNRPEIWIYESGALSGRLFSDITLEVEQWYRAAELDIVGAELPDHASLELAFLAHLCRAEQQEFSRFENDFLQRHILRWLPALGRAMVSSGDLVYAAIGRLLTDWLEEINPRDRGHQTRKAHHPTRALPAIQPDQVEDCILCGFCSQVCPTRALVVRENQQLTGLQLSPRLCVGCGQCVRVCELRVLKMEKIATGQEPAPGWQTLRNSPRPTCKACGKPLVSQAELAYVAARLGDPAWLELCQDCRPGLF